MRREWIGIALLAASWVFGLNYYHQAIPAVWVVLAAAGALLLSKREGVPPSRTLALSGIVLALPAVPLVPWPYKAAPCLLLAGLAIHAARPPRAWLTALGDALTRAGVVHALQGLAVLGYTFATARSHDLPAPLGALLAGVAQLFSMDAAFSGGTIALFTMRKVHPLAATWELLLDPVTLAFAVGGFTAIALRNSGDRRAPLVLALGLALWLPIRSALLMALMTHRALLTDYDSPLKLMDQFWSPWLLSALLAGPVFWAWQLVRPAGCDDPDPGAFRPRRRHWIAGPLLLGAAAALVTAGLLLDVPGDRRRGRVLVDEHHSTWEPTTRPFDTTWYGHDAGYNYACIYDYASRFYDLERLTNRISDAALESCDVLMLKVPTSAYQPDEVQAIVRFAAAGGGVLLVGEHTDVFHTSTHLNQVARMFGFEFRDDCLFGIDSPFHQTWQPGVVPHPIVQHMPPMDFAVSCSIAPGGSLGRSAILSTGLWSLPADYHASNFYPQVEDRADSRYGAFVQLWSTRYGLGRVVAFSDSTIFSNFSAFEPGKAELMLGMIEWLNRRNMRGDFAPGLAIVGVLLGLLSVVFLRPRHGVPLLVAAGLLGWTAAVVAVRHYHRLAMPPASAVRPLVRVVVDRTLSQVPLSESGFIKPSAEGFGIFEQWILRLGYFTSRRSGEDLFGGDALVFIHPRQPVSDAFRAKVDDYVRRGGRILVLDSSLNRKSTANSLLHPFGLSVERDGPLQGVLKAAEGWPEGVAVEEARAVKGGVPFAHLDGRPVAAVARHGKGLAAVVGFAARFNDDHMGVTTDLDPSPTLRQVFALEYRLVREVVGGFTNLPPAETAGP